MLRKREIIDKVAEGAFGTRKKEPRGACEESVIYWTSLGKCM
jgi:hypothetical protein